MLEVYFSKINLISEAKQFRGVATLTRYKVSVVLKKIIFKTYIHT